MSANSGRPDEEDHLRHLRETEAAAFLDGGLTATGRRRVQAHIDICDACRAELVDVGRATERRGLPTRVASLGYRRWWISAVAAAGIVALILVPRGSTRSRTALEPTRASRVADADGQRHIDVIAPSDDSTVTARALVFQWHAVPADVYKFSLLTESGDSIWTKETTDTVVTIPADAGVTSGSSYFWRVDAIGNGIVAKTRPYRINVVR